MKWTCLAFVAASVILASAQTAPPPSELMTHYRAYRAALESGDLGAAETEADQALQASIARDGEGGRTAVLATNLAQVRLSRGRTALAYPPALQAFTIVAAHGDAGVDPLLTRLVLGRAELTQEHDREGRAHLNAALRDVAQRPDLEDDAYNSAADLGRWLSIQRLFVSSAAAWAQAAHFANPQREERLYAYAEARMGQGIALYSGLTLEQDALRNHPTDTRLQIQTDNYEQADAAFSEVERILRPLAYAKGDGVGVTPAQNTYALALAWRRVMQAYLRSTGQQLVTAGQMAADRAGDQAISPNETLCETHVITEPEPTFPPNARMSVAVGAVTVRVLLSEQGAIEDIRVVASVPQQGFCDYVTQVLGQWRVERAEMSPANCTVPRVLFTTFRFEYH